MLVTMLTESITSKLRHSRSVKANAGDVLQPAAGTAVVTRKILIFRDLQAPSPRFT
jgi:hypothetical protein